MNAIELDSLFAAMNGGDAARSVILERLGHLHDCAERIRTERAAEWKRICAHRGIWRHRDTLFDIDGGHIDSFESNTGTITPSFRFRGYKGDGDSFESVTIPMEWLTLSEEALRAALTAQFDGYLAAAQASEAKKAQTAEAAEKAQLAALLAKHGPPTS